VLLAVDVGSSHTKVAVFAGDNVIRSWTLRTDPDRTPDELYVLIWGLLAPDALLTAEQIDAMAMCSVVPACHPAWKACADRMGMQLLVARHDTLTGLTIQVEHPDTVGADRLVASLGALRLYGGPVIVIDLGTATTINYVTEDGRYLGGAIAPGVGISANALFEHTAQLHPVPLVAPQAVLARSTTAQVQAGIVYGAAGQVDALVDRLVHEAGPARHVIATGGYARDIAAHCRVVTAVDGLLNLKGLQIFHRETKR
jgi:type III pantothenate kinase